MKHILFIFLISLSTLPTLADTCDRGTLQQIDTTAYQASVELRRHSYLSADDKLREIRELVRSCTAAVTPPPIDYPSSCVGYITEVYGDPTYNDARGYSYSGRLSNGAQVQLVSTQVSYWQHTKIAMVQVLVLNDSDYGQDQVGKQVWIQLNHSSLNGQCGLPQE